MALGIRGSNPIWLLVNQWGQIFDDTYYMYVLENTIPYIQATVYQDPDLNTPWSNGIQFLANGTLPDNIYFQSDVVYRLEFRQNNGITPASQNDPLIYEIDNYVAGEGGSTPISTVATTSSNQVTNPQFALINFGTPAAPTFTYTGAASALPIAGQINVAPGWILYLSGSGSVTITQVPLNNTTLNPTNAPYALQITLSGWTANSVYLAQRFQQNGMLWGSNNNQFRYVASSITAKLNGSPQDIGAILVDSNNTLLGNVLPDNTTISQSFNEFTGHLQMPIPNNPNTPPAAYIEYRLNLPSNIDIYVTSIQLVVEDVPVEPGFVEDSINRQIDHTYNTAYPIIPVGTVIAFMGFMNPAHYFTCDGSAISRIQYQLLFQTLTTTEIVTLTSGSNTFTVANPGNYFIGMAIEGTGIAPSTTITNIVGFTITMSNNATANGPNTVRFFIGGNGNGTTTFNLPNLLGKVLAGALGTLLTTNGPGGGGGTPTNTLIQANIPQHTHPNGSPLTGFVGPGGGGSGPFSGNSGSVFSYVTNTGNNSGSLASPTPVNNIQPTVLTRYCIRYE